jgi:hypothetical protein
MNLYFATFACWSIEQGRPDYSNRGPSHYYSYNSTRTWCGETLSYLLPRSFLKLPPSSSASTMRHCHHDSFPQCRSCHHTSSSPPCHHCRRHAPPPPYLLGSYTPGTVGRRLRLINLDTTGSLQWKTVRKPYTMYQIRPHLSWPRGRSHLPKKELDLGMTHSSV